VPIHSGITDGNGAEPFRRPLPGDHSGQKADAQSAGDQLDDEIDLAGAGGYAGLKAAALADRQDDGIEGEAFAEQDEGLVGQFPHFHLIPPGQGMVGGDQQVQGLAPYFLPVELIIHRQQRGGQIQLAGQDQFLQPFAALFRQLNLDAGIAAAEGGEQRREQDVGADGR